MRFIHYIAAVFFIITLSSFSHDKEKEKKKEEVTQAVVEDSIVEEDAIVLEEEEDLYEIVDTETKASYYHDKFTGRKTASGVVFDNTKYTAAHKTLPFGTKIRVTNLNNKRTVVLTVTDRGPYIKGRSVDLSKKAFFELTDNQARGVLDVKIEKLSASEN